MIFGIGTPSQEDVKDIRRNCQALLRAMEAHQRLENTLEAWTEGLMPAINILGNDGLDDTIFTTSFWDFSAVQHLFFIPQILTEVEPFLDDDSVRSDPLESLGSRYNPTISKSMLCSWALGPHFSFLFLPDMYLYDHMTSTHMTTYLYNRAILSGIPLFPPFVHSLLFSSYGSL